MTYLDNVEDIKSELEDPQVINDVDLARKALTRVQALSNAGCDTKQLFPAVVKYLVSSDLLVKKLTCWFISHHADQSELILLSINTLVNDCGNPNPMVRGLALRTLSKLPQPSLVEYWSSPCVAGLQDTSAHVRRVSIMACVKLHALDASFLDDHDVVDKLYSMVRDQDPIVVTNALRSLDEMLLDEGGIVVTKNMAFYLLNRLHAFSEWDLVTVFTTLKKYRPRNDEEALDIMNVADSYFKHPNTAVILVVWQYFMQLIDTMPHLHGEVNKRAKSQVLRCLGAANPELAMAILQYLEPIITRDPAEFRDKYKHFFTKYIEPVYVRAKKIYLLSNLVDTGNVEQIVEELMLCCIDIRGEVSSAAISALGRVARSVPSALPSCVNKLLSLMESQEQNVCCEVLKTLQDLDLQHGDIFKDIIECITNSVAFVEMDEGRAALIWMLGEYGEHMETSVYLLEHYLSTLDEDENTDNALMLPMLTATTKLFLKKPAECQRLLASVMEMCMSIGDMDIRDRAYLYYQLLCQDVETAKSVINTSVLP